ncbi:hypothetical protein C9426_05490 [Serratia sp. S1B]|nr:hypothetical protein C9426_05490 [Serratia sp. S1B]
MYQKIRGKILLGLLFGLVVALVLFPARIQQGWQYLYQGGWQSQGRLGPLTAQERQWATIAWRYIENNTQPVTGLVNGSDNYPLTTVGQIGDSMMAVLAAKQLGLIDQAEYDRRITTLLATLQALPLNEGIVNRHYRTTDAAMVDSMMKPAATGWSAQDIGRLLVALRLVRNLSPDYAYYVDKTVVNWNFCPLFDSQGMLLSGTRENGKLSTQDDLRLGYSEYTALGFQLWGFSAANNFALPYKKIQIYGIPLALDERDPRTTGVSNALTSTPYVLTGMEFQWQIPGDATQSKALRRQAQNIFNVQQLRAEKEGILTARADFSLSADPWTITDTVFASGYPWNTLDAKGNFRPEYAQLSTKALFGMWVLWDTPYTNQLMRLGQWHNDPQRGWFEGRSEQSGKLNKALTLSTNALVLESLWYKSAYGVLARDNPAGTFERMQQDVFNRPQTCLPFEPPGAK